MTALFYTFLQFMTYTQKPSISRITKHCQVTSQVTFCRLSDAGVARCKPFERRSCKIGRGGLGCLWVFCQRRDAGTTSGTQSESSGTPFRQQISDAAWDTNHLQESSLANIKRLYHSIVARTLPRCSAVVRIRRTQDHSDYITTWNTSGQGR